jgi:hypothetical protein
VFFLVGNFGGVSRRSDCPIPAGKALFLPILNVWGDNAGVTPDRIATDAELKSYVESTFDTIDRDSLRLLVDRRSVSGLARGAIRSAPYVAQLEPGKNQYDCVGIDDVQGEFQGYQSGFWAMLAPLPAGHHLIEFGGHVTSATPSNDLPLDISYTFDLD